MRTSEDVVYEAYSLGNAHVAALFKEVRKLKGGKYKYMETADKFEIAFKTIQERIAKKSK